MESKNESRIIIGEEKRWNNRKNEIERMEVNDTKMKEERRGIRAKFVSSEVSVRPH